jgi:hypothetical protein
MEQLKTKNLNYSFPLKKALKVDNWLLKNQALDYKERKEKEDEISDLLMHELIASKKAKTNNLNPKKKQPRLKKAIKKLMDGGVNKNSGINEIEIEDGEDSDNEVFNGCMSNLSRPNTEFVEDLEEI